MYVQNKDGVLKDLTAVGMKVTMYESVARQFNMYGFRKIVSADPHTTTYSNDYFVRDNEALQSRICRRTTDKLKSKATPKKRCRASEITASRLLEDASALHHKCSRLEAVITYANQQTAQRLRRFKDCGASPSVCSPPVTEPWPFDDIQLYDFGNGCSSPATSPQ